MKYGYSALIDMYNHAIVKVPIDSLWRHKGGDVYQVIGIDTDSDTGYPRVRYQVRVSKEVAPGACNPIIFSRPFGEWTLDRFAPLS